MRSFIRKAGIYRFLKRQKFSEVTILVDEGLFHSAHNFLCSPNRCAAIERVRAFVGLCPLPDKLIVLMSSEERLFEQLTRRGDLSPRVNDRNALVTFVRYSWMLFDSFNKLCALTRFGLFVDMDTTDELDVIRLGSEYIELKEVT